MHNQLVNYTKTNKLYNLLRLHIQDQLYRNSLFIIMASLLGSVSGFFFWMLAARIYPAVDVGVATAMISSMSLITCLARLGFDFSIMKFLSEYNNSKLLSTCIIISSCISISLGMIFILGIDIWSPNLGLLKSKNTLLYLIFLISYSIVNLSTFAFIAKRRSEFYVLQNIMSLSRILILPSMILASIGIFVAFGISQILALITTIFSFNKLGIRLSIDIDQDFLEKSFRFSAYNYFSSVIIIAPGLVLPILVLNLLGPIESARYYIVFTIASLLFMIPDAISTSLFVEGCYGKNLREVIIKSMKGIFSLLIPAITAIYLAGESVLRIIGEDYYQGAGLLKIMCLSGVLVALLSVYLSTLRIQNSIQKLLFISILLFLSLIGFSYLFISYFGLIGVGYAWLLSYALCLFPAVVTFSSQNHLLCNRETQEVDADEIRTKL